MPRMNPPTRTKSEVVAIRLILMLAVGLLLLCPAATSAQRRLTAGEKIPEFAVVDLVGKTFEHKLGDKRILMVAFLSAKRENTAKAATEIEEIVAEVAAKGKKLDIVVVVDDPNTSYFKSDPADFSAGSFHVILDTDFKLWGKFGVIAAPTVIIGGKNDEILWVKAGHSYNFKPLLRANLYRALGIPQNSQPDKSGEVKAVVNDTVAARAKRHVQMARRLAEKGRLDSAIRQMEEAGKMDPNSIDVALGLAELHLKSAQGGKALKAIAQFIARTLCDKSRRLLISARAKRQIGELDAAEKLLIEAASLSPKCSETLFELGKVYQAKSQTEKAMTAYRKALSLVFGDESCSVDSQK